MGPVQQGGRTAQYYLRFFWRCPQPPILEHARAGAGLLDLHEQLLREEELRRRLPVRAVHNGVGVEHLRQPRQLPILQGVARDCSPAVGPPLAGLAKHLAPFVQRVQRRKGVEHGDGAEAAASEHLIAHLVELLP